MHQHNTEKPTLFILLLKEINVWFVRYHSYHSLAVSVITAGGEQL